MSSTNRGAKRTENDFYPTPAECIDAIMSEIKPSALNVCTWLEPCAGDFRIYDRMPEGRREWAEIQHGRDYFANKYQADIALTNLPFAIAQDFAEKLLRECKSVIVLERLNWLGSDERKEFWQANPPTHLFVLANRPSFTAEQVTAKVVDLFECEVTIGGNKGNDSTEYAWFAWDKLGILKRPPGLYVI